MPMCVYMHNLELNGILPYACDMHICILNFFNFTAEEAHENIINLKMHNSFYCCSCRVL